MFTLHTTRVNYSADTLRITGLSSSTRLRLGSAHGSGADGLPPKYTDSTKRITQPRQTNRTTAWAPGTVTAPWSPPPTRAFQERSRRESQGGVFGIPCVILLNFNKD
ncbi:hypothetical protein AOLI_G00102650 [Acnodon oligacanthus]